MDPSTCQKIAIWTAQITENDSERSFYIKMAPNPPNCYFLMSRAVQTLIFVDGNFLLFFDESSCLNPVF